MHIIKIRVCAFIPKHKCAEINTSCASVHWKPCSNNHTEQLKNQQPALHIRSYAKANKTLSSCAHKQPFHVCREWVREKTFQLIFITALAFCTAAEAGSCWLSSASAVFGNSVSYNIHQNWALSALFPRDREWGKRGGGVARWAKLRESHISNTGQIKGNFHAQI